MYICSSKTNIDVESQRESVQLEYLSERIHKAVRFYVCLKKMKTRTNNDKLQF